MGAFFWIFFGFRFDFAPIVWYDVLTGDNTKGLGMTATEIKALREQLGMTQREFAVALHTTVTSVSRWEHGASKPLEFFVVAMRELPGRETHVKGA